MNAIDEREVRQRLRDAMQVLDPQPPPLDALRARATRRRRRRTAGMGLLAAVAAAAVVVALVVVMPGGTSQTVKPATAPSRQSLVTYANAHGGTHVAGPAEFEAGYFGAFTTDRAIQAVRYRGHRWVADGPAVTAFGPGRYVTRLDVSGLTLSTAPAFAIRVQGGDVSYFGGVLYRAGKRWRPVRFDGCGHHGLCPPGTTQPYGHPTAHGFTSVSNDCTPYCAAGTQYRITWSVHYGLGSGAPMFGADEVRPVGRWADRP